MHPVILAAVTIGDKLDTIFYGFDMLIFRIFGAIQCGFLTVISKLFTSLADSLFVIPLMAIGMVLALCKRTRKYGFALVIAIGIGTLFTNLIIKPMVLRIRPYNTLQSDAEYFKWYVTAGMLSEADYSFPSGHTTSAFEIAAALFMCYRSDGKKKIAWIFPVIAFFSMCSRVYLMVHYPSDVIAGFFVGAVSGVAGYYLALLGLKICEIFPMLDAIDAERWIKRDIKPKTAKTVLLLALTLLLCISFASQLLKGGESVLRCAYDGVYDCQNAARVDAFYPPIDGEYYCKIHWKELSGEND